VDCPTNEYEKCRTHLLLSKRVAWVKSESLKASEQDRSQQTVAKARASKTKIDGGCEDDKFVPGFLAIFPPATGPCSAHSSSTRFSRIVNNGDVNI
jgi:hypothetical protein